MARIRQVGLCIIVVCMLVGINPGPLFAMEQGAEITSNQYTQADSINTDWETYQEIPETFKLVGENDTFQLYLNEATIAFKVVDKRSGYVWHSNLDEKIDGDKLNKTWTAFAESGISVEYLDEKAVSKRISITNSETSINIQPVEQGFEAAINFNDISISLSINVELEQYGVSVKVPFESIKQEDPEFKLGKVFIYPFFGATRDDTIPGYMFIPDGPGSLIRFTAQTKAKNMFYGRYYDSDLGMITALPYDPTLKRPLRISLPVFGMVHGYKQNAFISIVEKGASYAELQAHPGGIITNFNFLYNAFVYNESFFQATNRSGAGVTTIQQNTNAFDVEMHYRFLTGDDSDYVGMARSYQLYLVERGVLHKDSADNSGIGIRLEFLAGEKEKVLFWKRSISMTTISQMAEILDDLQISNKDVIYYGWQPYGASNMPPKTLEIDGNIGTIDQLNTLVEKISAEGGNLHMYLDPQAAIYDESGYSPRYDLAMSITDGYLIGYNRDKLNYYFNIDTLSERYTNICDGVLSQLNAGLALDGIGSIVFSDFKANHVLNREEAIARYQKLLAEQKCVTAFYMPNDYVFGVAQSYYDMPITNNGYTYTTDLVPFIQIALSGYIAYFGSALNFSSNLQEDLLRHIDYGVYPSFFLTHDATSKILNTRSNWIYTSSYDQWDDEVKQTYQWLNSLLGPVKGQEIIGRQVLTDGVVATSYANGKHIIVNYGNQPFVQGGLSVASKDAVLTEVLP